MKIPATALSGHLMWTRSGVVWASWRLQGLSYAFRSRDEKLLVQAHHQALFQALRGEGLLVGLCAELDPAAVAERMLAGVDLRSSPSWGEEVRLTMDALEQVPLGTRAYWLCVPLPAGSLKGRMTSALRAGEVQLRDLLALPRARPGARAIADAMKLARRVEEQIPAAFKPSRTTRAEQIWMAMHAQHRGLSIDSSAPVPAPGPESTRFATAQASIERPQLPAALPNPWLDEGGQSDLAKRAQQMNPFHRRYLKVQSPHSELPSYQVMQALVSGPKGGWEMPGVEWISRVEQYDLDVDWAIRFRVSSAEHAKLRTRRAENNLNDQINQQSTDDASTRIVAAGADLGDVAAQLAAYNAALNRSDKEVEVEATTIFAVGAHDPELARARAQFIADDYKASDFLLETSLGGQEALWWAMQPGTPPSRLLAEVSQISTGREFASGVPMVTTALGDPKGARFGENITNGRHTPILRDLDGNILADVSGSFGVVAELGAGKSVLLKCEASQVVDRGGRFICIDRTTKREYAVFARALPRATTTIVDLMAPEYSLDPLRVFGPRVGARMVQSLFSVLLGVHPRDPRGVLLSRLLEPAYVEAHEITSLARLVSHIHSLERTDILDELMGLIALIATKDLGEVLFNDQLPALELSTTAIVFLTAGLELPDRLELENAHLFEELSLEKIYGRAMYALLMAITREVCFSDDSQLALFVADETHHITASPEGERELRIFLRDGRKHRAAAGLGSHDPADFGDTETRSLIKTRYVMRQPDLDAARRAIAWLGLDATDEELLNEAVYNLSPVSGPDGFVALERRGEGLMRDVAGEYGKFRKTLPENPERRAAVLSTPGAVPVADRAQRQEVTA